MTDNCNRHLFDVAEDRCRQCREAYCGDCLVYTDGGSAPPMCINCALERSGVRGSRRSKRSWRIRRAVAKVEKADAEMRAGDRTEDAPPGAAETGERWEQLDATRWDLDSA